MITRSFSLTANSDGSESAAPSVIMKQMRLALVLARAASNSFMAFSSPSLRLVEPLVRV